MLDIGLLRNLQGIIDFDPKVPYSLAWYGRPCSRTSDRLWMIIGGGFGVEYALSESFVFLVACV